MLLAMSALDTKREVGLPSLTEATLHQARLDQVELHAPRFLFITALSIVIGYWLLSGMDPVLDQRLTLWASLFLLFLVGHRAAFWFFSLQRRPNRVHRERAQLVLAALTALFWCGAVLSLKPELFSSPTASSDLISRKILFSGLIGVQGISALTAYVGHFRTYALFTTLLFVPTLTYLALQPNFTSLLIIVMGLLWWLFLLHSARYLNTTLMEAVSLRLNNEQLINFLRQSQSRALAINNRLAAEVRTRTQAEQALQTLNGELEARVAERTQALQESQDNLTLAIEAAGIALWDWRLDEGRFQHVNLFALMGCEGMGDEQREGIRLQARRLIHPDDFPSARRDLVAHLRGKTPFYRSRYRVRHRDQHWVWVEDQGRVVARDAAGHPLRIVGVRRDVSAEYRAEETQRRLDYLTQYDRLTQLANRRQFQRRLQETLVACQTEQQGFGLVILNLDRFRQINESLGFDTGDAILRETGRRLASLGDEFELIARLNGDEFAFINRCQPCQEDLSAACQRILQILAKPYLIGDHELLLAASLGVSRYPLDGRDITMLSNHADLALQAAKRAGGNQFRFYQTDMRSASIEQLNLESSLRRALARDEFRVHYQPKLAMGSQRIVGMEALVRWQHPTLGLLQPGRFIPLAEETGLIEVITEHVLMQATAQVKAWADQGLGALTVAVNIPAQQFRKGDLLETVKEALASSGLPPHQLELEITESSLMEDPDLTLRLLTKMRERGLLIALDDFGTGYSSLSHLRRFPVDTLKIDQTFIRALGDSPEDGAIVHAIVTLAHQLGMTVTAEGVETVDQLDILHDERCDYVQGFLISRPVPAEEMEALLRQQLTSKIDNTR